MELDDDAAFVELDRKMTAGLADWARRIREIGRWKRAYVYLKHDEAGRAPELAQAFLAELA